MKRYTFHDVSFEAPSTWTDLSVVTLAGEDSRTFQPTLVITRDDAPKGDLKRYAQSQAVEIKKVSKGATLVSEGAVEVGGKKGYLMEYRLFSPEKIAVLQKQYFVISGKEVVVISLASAEKEAEKRKDTFKKIVRSLKMGPS